MASKCDEVGQMKQKETKETQEARIARSSRAVKSLLAVSFENCWTTFQQGWILRYVYL